MSPLNQRLGALALLLLVGGSVQAGTLPLEAPAVRGEHEIVFKLSDGVMAATVRESGQYVSADGMTLDCVPALPRLQHDPQGLNRILRLPFVSDEHRSKILAGLQQDAHVEWAEIPPVRQTDVVPNDSDWAELWALPHVEAPAAWDVAQCNGDVLLAIVDTGTQLDHPDLAANIHTNTVELNGTAGVDDDQNGYVDDVHGYDVRDHDADPSPMPGDSSHGTHTSGTAACVTNNATGVACIAWNPRLLPVRAGHASSITAGIEGIFYAFSSNARVISCSWGGDSYSYYEQNVIQAALEAGSLVVAAAGNNGNTLPHYPGAYEGVLSVASVNSTDVLASSSTRGAWVDLTAPGVSIWSTVNNSTYGTKSGTSMATPQVASLCALLSSTQPFYSPAQLREHVIFTCDDIDALNPAHSGELGRGRINARRALTESPATIDLRGIVLDDANGNGIPDLGEVVGIDASLVVDIGALTGIQAVLSCADPRITIQDGSSAYGSLQWGQSSAGDGFSVQIGNSIPTGTRVELLLNITANGGFSHRESFPLVVAPIHASHDNSNLNLTVSSHGAIGYYDFEDDQAVGQGFRWPSGGANHLYVGSLLISHQPSGMVADVASYLSGHAPDFAPVPGSLITLSENGAEQRISASFNDSPMASPIGLEIDLVSRSLDMAGVENGVILEYQLRNTGAQTLSGLRAGLWMDFDVNGTWANDTGGWDAARSLGYMTDAGNQHLGVKLLSDPASSYRLCRWNDWSSGGLQDAEILAYVEGGFVQTQSTGADDWQCCLAGPAFSLAPTSVRTVVFALVAGESLQALQQNADELQSWWEATDVVAPEPELPQDFGLVSIRPNPFNPTTRIDLDLSHGTRVAWEVHDLQGRLVHAAGASFLAAGSHSLPVDLAGSASGVYLLTLHLDDESRNYRITLLK
ncbi:MAG: S8 family serine peptidase [Calditrichaeota bacterium]|nr:S8 family serine peptidase [Candidatus Cloacimonadota bacterium]MCB1045564.1 S8 family serine peptidase [Calditrichota bacterium]MCB9473291.1 S8 family serine peptidase [Candidatus Delongbacteria bacterium]